MENNPAFSFTFFYEYGCMSGERSVMQPYKKEHQLAIIMENKNCQVTMAHMMLPRHTNADGNIHGGVIMKFIDEAAAVVAMQHARTTVVTASIDQLDFHKPVFIGNLLILKAALNLTGNSSMEIGVRVEAEDLKKGTSYHIASAYLSFVAVDINRKPTTVPPYTPVSMKEKQRHREAQKRKQQRIQI